MAVSMNNDEDDERIELTDELLAALLVENKDVEHVTRIAGIITAFYKRIALEIDVVQSQSGDIHDVALEITREWMTYTMGEL